METYFRTLQVEGKTSEEIEVLIARLDAIKALPDGASFDDCQNAMREVTRRFAK